MRFIRTENKVYRNASTDKDIVIICKKRRLTVNPKDIIKQADTIEELCDEFIDIDNHDYYKISHKDGITFALSKTERLLGNYDIRCEEIGQIMGSIYTDKGLIYVAKMNDKGELELL